MPSLTPLSSHCRRGTNTKSAMEGFSVPACKGLATRSLSNLT
jgi:hypothetical protein